MPYNIVSKAEEAIAQENRNKVFYRMGLPKERIKKAVNIIKNKDLTTPELIHELRKYRTSREYFEIKCEMGKILNEYISYYDDEVYKYYKKWYEEEFK